MDEGRLAGYVGTLINITVQKRDRQRSHEHEVRFRAIFEQSPIGIAMTDRDTRFLQTNAAFQRMVGYTEEELANLSAMELTYPEDRERDRRLVGELALARENFSIEKRYVRKDGGLVWARVTVSLVRSPDGSYRYGIGMVEDITERKAAEEQLRQAQKMEAIGRLAGGVAHEFRNQLTVIKGYAEMLLRQDLVDEAGRQFVGDILQAVDRSVLISRELLAFGRKQVLHPERVRLDELVRRTAGSLSQLMGRDIEVSLRLHGGSSCVKVDANQFQQAVVNLALNARDAMPRGGRLIIQTANVELDERFAQENAGATAGPYVRIAVSDTGVGMDKETLEQVFEPFFTTKPAGEGIGLGLPMVYGFVRQSGGCVTVSSEPRRGTTVTLYLPLADVAGEGQ
jgi:PAS domain S-box-containing protein